MNCGIINIRNKCTLPQILFELCNRVLDCDRLRDQSWREPGRRSVTAVLTRRLDWAVSDISIIVKVKH